MPDSQLRERLGLGRPAASRAGALEPEALAAYRARMSALRIRYSAVIAGAVVLALIGAGLLWLTGESHHATLRTATSPERAVADDPLGATLSVAWSSTDATATGSFASHGVVATYSQHTVRGRDALSGAVRWSYTRSDATVCGLDSRDGVAVAIFRLDGNCDEAIGLNLATGSRLWNRTLMDDGDSTLQSRPGSLAITTSTSVHVISPAAEAKEPSGGLDRWFYRPAGCTVVSSVPGPAGVLVSTRCAAGGEGAAGGQGASGAQPRLVLRKANDDGEVWSLNGEAAVPLLAESAMVLGWDAKTGQLIAFDPTNGRRTAALNLPQCTASDTPVAQASSPDALIQCGQTLSRISLQGAELTVRWSIPAAGLPATPTNAEQASHSAVIRTGTGFATIDIATGASAGPTVAVPANAAAAVAAATRIERFGPGVLIAGSRTVMLQPPG